MKQYIVRSSKHFRRDLRRLKRSQCQLDQLGYAIDLLANNEVLPERCHDHALLGEFQGCRACHIRPDWLLMYAKDEDVLILLRTGTHRDVLGIE